MSGPIDRVIVPLDAASENRAAIDTAARLAARARAPLRGAFIEDEDLFRLAGLPFARQVTQQAGAGPLTPEQVGLQLRAAAERSRRELADAARRHSAEFSFEVIRGGAEAALSAAGERDLVVAGGSTKPIAGHFRLTWRWWSSLGAGSAPFLVARRHWNGGGSTLVVLSDFGPSSGRLLDSALLLAEARRGAVRIVSSTAGIGDPAGLNEWLEKRLGKRSARLQVEAAPADPGQLPQLIRQLDCGLVAVPAGIVQAGADAVRELAESVACDVLIVR